MNRNELLNYYNIDVESIEKNKNITIINKKYVFKKTNRQSNFYEYLLSRGFNNFPKIYSSIDDKDEMMEYIIDSETPNEQKLEDLIYIASILHKKTQFNKNITLDDKKKIYESTIDKINDINNYYMNKQTEIEEEEYIFPANYLLIRNISLIYKSLSKAREYIEKWYKEIEKEDKIRYSYIHGNLEKEHVLENDNIYLISWDKSKIDLLINDIEIYYRNNYNNISLENTLNIYESNNKLSIDEYYLLLTNLLIPNKLIENRSEFLKTKETTKLVVYLEKVLDYLEKYSEETNNDTYHQQEY